jgi:hypothetical protein
MTPLNDCFRIAELEKKIKELNDQIRVYKNELSDKQKEFAQEKADLQTVIDQMKMGGEQVGNHDAITKTFSFSFPFSFSFSYLFSFSFSFSGCQRRGRQAKERP